MVRANSKRMAVKGTVMWDTRPTQAYLSEGNGAQHAFRHAKPRSYDPPANDSMLAPLQMGVLACW